MISTESEGNGSETTMTITLTSRQRVTAALRHVAPDRTPIFEYVPGGPAADAVLGREYLDYANETAARWHARAAEWGWERAVRQYAVDRAELAERLGHDLLYLVPNPLPPRSAAPGAPTGPAPPVPDDPVERLRLRNERNAAATPTVDPDGLGIYPAIREELARRGLDLPLLAPAYAHGIWSDLDLLMSLALEPEVAAEHFAQCTRHSLARVEAYLALGIEQIGIGGDFAGNRVMIRPEQYAALVAPELAVVARRIRDGGATSANASDGDLWPVIEAFLLTSETDGYLEIDARAGMDLGRLKAYFGNRITFYGNMDCGEVLCFGTPESIRAETLACLEAGDGDGGHIFCASNAITHSVPVANYLAMVNAYREYVRLPPLRLT